MMCCCCCLLVLALIFLTLFLLLRRRETSHADDFEPRPPRIVLRTADPAISATELLPPSLGALLLRSNKLSASRLEVLEFDDMESLRVVVRKLAARLGDRAPPDD